MIVTVDRFGRVVIPKQVRDSLGITAGTLLSADQTEDAVILRLPERKPIVEEEDGVLVFVGDLTGDLDETLRSVRRARGRRVWSTEP